MSSLFLKIMVKYILKQKIENAMYTKQSNLIISLDLTKASEIIDFIKLYCHDVFGIKLHSDIIKFDTMTQPEFMCELMILKHKMNFILIEDRKFCDIGNTVMQQSYEITKYADLITVHAIPGQGIIDGLKNNCLNNECGILLISQMSSNDNLISDEYTQKTIELALENNDIVVGFICQEKMTISDNSLAACVSNRWNLVELQEALREFLHFSPGVKLQKSQDNLGQNYNTPSSLHKKGINFFIVGRDIYEAKKPLDIIDEYNSFYSQTMAKNIFKQKVIDAGIIKKGNFILSSGEQSTVYADFRLLNGNSNLLKIVAKEFTQKLILERIGFGNMVLMGVPMGGISLAAAISLESGIPFVIVREKRKEYGSKNLIEGMSIDELKTKKIILVEDVMTTGVSVEKIIDKVKTEENLDIGLVMCIMDRCKGGDKHINNKFNINVLKLFSLNDF